MNNFKRTHRLALSNAIGDLKTIGFLIADEEALAIIAPLIADRRIFISLNDETDINALTKLTKEDKGKYYMNNTPAILSLDKAPAKPIAPKNAVITPKATTTAADEMPF